MRKGRFVLSFCVALLALSSSSLGQVRKGLNEIAFNGSLDVLTANGSSATSAEVGIGYGHFLTDQAELGGGFSLIKIEGIDAFGTFGGFFSFHFPSTPESKAVPYIGGNIGLGYGDPFDNPFIFGGYGGFKLFIASGGAISIEPFYQRYNYSGGGINNFGVRTGISLFF
ncbi:MAG TPA: hypothetical protein VI546_01545 [candidate division Zixibacteria bacterium]|nr:hypothetical protein [candidate division Zixibacteria bacterium]